MAAYPMLTTLSACSPALPALLALNNEYECELAPVEAARFRWLVEHAFFAAAINENEAFLLAFEQSAAYHSPNFLWFKQRFTKFVYVDRLATSTLARGRGHAIALYDALFSVARAAGHNLIVCEMNEAPPNPISAGLHARFGFVKAGEAVLPEMAKTVGYFVKKL